MYHNDDRNSSLKQDLDDVDFYSLKEFVGTHCALLLKKHVCIGSIADLLYFIDTKGLSALERIHGLGPVSIRKILWTKSFFEDVL